MPDPIANSSPSPLSPGRRGKIALIGAGLLALGSATGAVVMAEARPSATMAPASPAAIRSLPSSGIVTIRGRVAEIFGNKFIMADASGRALVDTGREGDGRQLVTPGEPVTVQGRLERGLVHAAFLVGSDNQVVALGPLAGPPHPPRGPHCGPDRGPGAPPPPSDDDAVAPLAPPAPVPAAGAAAGAATGAPGSGARGPSGTPVPR